MSKKGGSAPKSPDPYKTAATDSRFNRLDTYGPAGGGTRYGYTDPQTGQFVQGTAPKGAQSAVSTVESPWEKAIREALQPASVDLTERLITDNVTNLPNAPRVQDRGTVADSIFNRTMSMMQPSIDKSNSRLLTNLQARGIPIGADAFNSAMGEQTKQTQDTISRLAMDADIQAGGEQSRLFGLDSAARQSAMAEIIAAMGGTYNPPNATPSGNATPVGYSSLVANDYASRMAQYNSDQQSRTGLAGTLGGLGAAMIGKSDILFKRDIREIGRRGAFMAYEFRYIWDRPGTARRGYMVQDVRRIMPQAVVRIGRWLHLDYSMLPEV